MRAIVSMFLMAAASTTASAQQSVTLIELHGKIMQATALSDRVMRRDGRQFPEQYQTDWKIIFQSSDTINVTFIGTSSTARGKVQSPIRALERKARATARNRGTGRWAYDLDIRQRSAQFPAHLRRRRDEGQFHLRARCGLAGVRAASVLWLREVERQRDHHEILRRQCQGGNPQLQTSFVELSGYDTDCVPHAMTVLPTMIATMGA